MNVLHGQREPLLPAVFLARLTDGAGGGIRPEALVVGAAIVVAGEAEERREGKDHQRRREREPARPPGWSRAEPRVWRVAEELRRVERRKVRSGGVVLVLEGRPRCV